LDARIRHRLALSSFELEISAVVRPVGPLHNEAGAVMDAPLEGGLRPALNLVGGVALRKLVEVVHFNPKHGASRRGERGWLGWPAQLAEREADV
jgi:hypothetical protein